MLRRIEHVLFFPLVAMVVGFALDLTSPIFWALVRISGIPALSDEYRDWVIRQHEPDKT
jgi:hypothetical protein